MKVLLGGSWVVISGVISPLVWVIIRVTLIITPQITGLRVAVMMGLSALKICGKVPKP